MNCCYMRIVLCMAMLLHILVNLYCICDLYVKVSLIIFLDTLYPSSLGDMHTFHGYCVDVASLQIVHVVWAYEHVYACTSASVHLPVLAHYVGVDVLCFCFMFPLNRSKARSTLISLPAQCLCTCMHKFSVLFLHVCLWFTWCTGALVHLVYRCTGSPDALVHWCTGALVHWCTGTPAWCTGALVHLVHQCTGSLVHWFTGAPGVPVYWFTCFTSAGAVVHWFLTGLCTQGYSPDIGWNKVHPKICRMGR